MCERWDLHRGEFLSSPRQLLVLLPYNLRAFSTGAATALALLPCAVPASLSSCPKPFLSPLSNTSSFLLSFTLWFWVRFSVPAQTAERKDGPEVRVTAWPGESHIQFSLPLTPPLTLGFVFHTSFCPPLLSSKYCSEIFMFYLWTSIKHSKHPELDVGHQPLQKKKRILSILAGCLSLGETAILASPTGRLGQVSPSLPKGQHCSSIPQGTEWEMNMQRCCSSPSRSPKGTWGQAELEGWDRATQSFPETPRLLLLGREKEEEKCNKRQE